MLAFIYVGTWVFLCVCSFVIIFGGGGDVRGVVSLFCSVLKRVCNQEED